MKKVFFLVIILAAGFKAVAATGVSPVGSPDAAGKISGTVIDEASGQPVEFATVALVDPATNKPIDGTVCDDKGKFTLKNIEPGKYKLTISFIGFETKSIDVTVPEKGDVDLGDVKIGSTAKELEEVVVQGERVLIEEKVDRTIYNAENDATAKGGDASDVLRRVPLLSVDFDGNVSMRGNSNITVLINNKPSTIMAGSIADALKQIPADQIKTVEVITSPSAKYDAEGSAGSINIRTKKNTLQGATLNVDAGVGYRGSNLGLNGSYRKGKMGFNLGGFGRANYNNTGKFESDQITRSYDEINDELTLAGGTIQRSESRSNNLFGRYQLGWDYEINKKNYLAASVRYGVRNGNNYQDNLYTYRFDENENPVSTELRNTESADLSGTVDFDVSYTKSFNKPQQELSFLALYSRNDRTNDFENISYDPTDESTIIRKVRNDNKNYNEEMTLQFDYQSPINTNQMLEFGAKQIVRKVSSDFTTFRAEGDGAYIKDPTDTLTNTLNYDQNVTAGYLSYTINLSNGYSFKAGSRYEYTTITAYTRTESNIEIPSYGVIVPSINASKKFKSGNVLKLSYNRRIQRPSIRFLNPNIQAANPYNQTIGNPNLDPEYTDNYEIGYSTGIKGTSLNFSAFMRNTTGSIQSIREPIQEGSDTILTRYANIGQEDAYGLSVFANVNIGKLTVNGGGDVYYAVMDNNLENFLYQASNEGWVANYRIFGSYNLEKGWGLQFFGFYRAPQVQLQGKQGGFAMYSVAVRKEFANKKGSVGLGIENFLTPQLKIKNETVSPLVVQNSLNTRDMLSFRFNISYRFGKMSFDNTPRRRKRSISNDDMKDGGGDDGGMGQMGGDTQQRSSGMSGGMGRGTSAPVAAAAPIEASTDSVIYEATGTWNYTLESPQGGTGKLVIVKEGENYSGTIKSNRMPQEVAISDIKVDGNNISFTYQLSFGGNTVSIAVQGVISGDEMKANMSLGQFGTFPMNGKREIAGQ